MMLNRIGKEEHTYLVTTIKGHLSNFSLLNIIFVGYFVDILIKLSSPVFLVSSEFYPEWCCILSNVFSMLVDVII